jgi:carbon storage regulator CsrA
MLVIPRRRGETIVIDPRNCPPGEDGLITIQVIDFVPSAGTATKVRLGIQASRHVAVHRQEVYDCIRAVNSPPPPADANSHG